jgi:hypothetical protein
MRSRQLSGGRSEQVGHPQEQIAVLEWLGQRPCRTKGDGGIRVHPVPGLNNPEIAMTGAS